MPVAAKKQFILDCGTCTVLRTAVSMLIHTRTVCISTHDDTTNVQWYLLPNKWAIRESIYRMNVYDHNGAFVGHAYDWFQVGSIIAEEQ